MDELQRYTMYDDHMTRGIDALPTKYGQWVKYEDAVRIVQQRNDLLARIHGDGGQYIDKHGLDKAIEDAHTEVGRLHAEIMRLREALEYYANPKTYAGYLCLIDPSFPLYSDQEDVDGVRSCGKRARAVLKEGE